MDFFENQERAKNKTSILVLYFLLAIIAIIMSVNVCLWLAFSLVDPHYKQAFIIWLKSDFSVWVSIATTAVIFLGSMLRMMQLAGGGRAIAKMVGARRILPETSDPLEKRLINVVEEMSIASGMVPPRLYVLDDEKSINAFVAGTQPQDAVLVVTRGAIEQLNRDQLQGVIGHEYSHIAHGDMRLNVRLMGLLAGILLIGQCGSFILRNLTRGSSSSSSDSGKATFALFIIGFVLMVVGYIGLFFGRLIKAAISRQREFLADASSVQYTRNNESLAGALAKIGLAPERALLNISNAEEMSHMCFGESVELSFGRLLATHPPIEERIKALGFTPDVFMRRVSTNEKQDESTRKLQIDAKTAAVGVMTTMASIGTLNKNNLTAAHKIKFEIGEKIDSATHDRLQAPDLLIALLIHADDQNTTQQQALHQVENQLGSVRKSAVVGWLVELQNLQPRHRLAILNAMRATLDFLKSDERVQLINLLTAIANIDKKVSLFEFVLVTLAQKWLQPLPPPKGVVRRFVDVADDLSEVIGLMVTASGAPSEDSQRQYETAMKSFSVPIKALPRTFNAARLQAALNSLNRLVPMLKKPLLTTLVELAMHDHKLNVDEGELLRVIAEQLNCPVPVFNR